MGKSKVITIWILALLLGLFLSLEVQAGVELFKWDIVAGASDYPVETSVDGGLTWQLLTTIASTACTIVCSVSLTLPDTGYVLVRIGAKNANGTTMRAWTGFFHCNSCKPLEAAKNLSMP